VNSFLYNRLLNLTLKYAGTYTVKFYNLYGSEVMSNTYSGDEDLQIDLNNLVTGFYNFVVISEGRIIYKNKLILN
jgi:hypothetical protein